MLRFITRMSFCATCSAQNMQSHMGSLLTQRFRGARPPLAIRHCLSLDTQKITYSLRYRIMDIHNLWRKLLTDTTSCRRCVSTRIGWSRQFEKVLYYLLHTCVTKQGCGLDRSSGSSPSPAVDHRVRVRVRLYFFPSATHAPYNQLTDECRILPL